MSLLSITNIDMVLSSYTSCKGLCTLRALFRYRLVIFPVVITRYPPLIESSYESGSLLMLCYCVGFFTFTSSYLLNTQP